MTKQNNATVNPCNLNLEKMTHAYFYPNILLGDISTLQIPTTEELKLLGWNNLQQIKWFLRREEKKMKAGLHEVQRGLSGFGLKTPEVLQNERASKGGFINCNWRGMKYGKLPEGLEEKLDDADESCAEVFKREKKIFTCKFGRHVAEWCRKTPNVQSCTGMCSQHTRNNTLLVGSIKDPMDIEITLACVPEEGTSNAEARCPHYDTCYGLTPFKGELCVFDHADGSVIRNCTEYLEKVVADYTTRLEFVKRYLANITTANRDKCCAAMPPFELNAQHVLLGCENGTRIVTLTIKSESDKFVLKHGTVGRIKGVYGENVWFLVPDNEPLLSAIRISFNKDYREHFYGVIMREEDFDYLVSHRDFRQVWLQMTSFSGTGFNASHVAQILEALAEV